jgi:two-component system, NarL family, sensor histidine kinase DevS
MSLEREPSCVRRLLDVWVVLISELDEQVVLDCVLEAAREITGARYAAVTILNDERTQLLRLLTSEVDGATRCSVEELARGTAALGAPIVCPQPLCVADAGVHAHGHGRPDEHAGTRSFLGAPLMINGLVSGNLHLTEKVEGEFTEADEEGAAILARWASIAIENARLYEAGGRRREAERSAGPCRRVRLGSCSSGILVARRRGDPTCPGRIR